MENKRKERLRTYYAVEDGWGGQRGCFIEEVKMTQSEFREETSSPANRKGRALFTSYAAALYYTQD